MTAMNLVASMPLSLVISARCGRFFVGLTERTFAPFAAEQKLWNWCWAACVQMVLNWNGLQVRQTEIVNRIYGWPIDEPANVRQILTCLSGLGPHVAGGTAEIEACLADCDEDVLNDLFNGKPLIAGLMRRFPSGHCYVVTGATYDRDCFGAARIATVIVWNPAPGCARFEEMSWDEFRARMSFVARVRVTRLF